MPPVPPLDGSSSSPPGAQGRPGDQLFDTPPRALFLPPATGPRPWRLLVLFLMFATGISALGWWAYTSEAALLRQRGYEELNAIAHFKAAQIGSWLAERRWDAKLVFDSRFSRQDFTQWLESRDPVAGERLKARLESLLVNKNYVSVELLDPGGIPRLAVGVLGNEPAGRAPPSPASSSGSDEPQLVDLYRQEKNDPVRLAYLLPITSLDAQAPVLLGHMRITIDPDQILYPLIQSWPTPSRSAETLIVRRDGDSVLYLNELRHVHDTALKMRLPLTRGDLSATRAVLGEEGIFEGRDYRGVEVISDLRSIPGTPWRLVTKRDRAEVFQSIREVAQVTALATAVLLLFTSVVLWQWWRRQQMSARLDLQQELERIADVSPGVIHSFCLRPDGSSLFPYASPAIRNVYGFAPEELAEDASPVMDRIHPDDARWLKAAVEASARDLSTWQAEYRYQHPDKGEIWVEEKSVPTRQPDGSTVWYGFLSDVTERKQAEQALRESESRFSTVFRDSPLGISISQVADGMFIEVNEEFLRIFGQKREDVIGHTSGELKVWGDDSERSRLIGRLQEEGVPGNVEVKFRRRSGEMLDVLYTAGIIELKGEPYLLSLLSDITSLRHAEQALAVSRERYRSLFEHMLDGYALCRMRYEGENPVDFICLEVNPAFEGLTGLQDVVGKWVTDIVPGIRESNPDLFEVFGRVARGGRAERLESYVGALERWFSIAVFSAEPEHFVAVFDNITERKQAQLALEAHRDQLEAAVAARTAELVAANKELQAFTYAASHDLKAPLRGISGFATLLEQEYRDRLEGDGARYLDHICKSAVKMTALINDLLAYAHVDQHTQQLRNVDLPEAVDAILAESQEEIRQLGTELRLAVPPTTVRADSHGLAQVLRNLVGNALKYSAKAAHPVVEIGGEVRDDCCRLWVRDNGIGFDMAHHERIFEIFRRLQSDKDFQGTGVGLALVRKAMERMGGRVWAESAPGQGATFYLELPTGGKGTPPCSSSSRSPPDGKPGPGPGVSFGSKY